MKETTTKTISCAQKMPVKGRSKFKSALRIGLAGLFLALSVLIPSGLLAQPCVTPGPVTASPDTVCLGDSSALVAISTGNIINWYDAASGGNLLGSTASGGNFMVTPTGMTTYWAEALGIASDSIVFSHTGTMQTFTVPSGVTSLTIVASGAQGATAADRSNTNGLGGLGGSATGVLTVVPGQILNVYVGGQGQQSGAGGFNGGGTGGFGTAGSSCVGGPAGGGGGASDVRVGGTALTDRVIVAAGGGGAGRDYCNGSCQPCGCGGAGGGAGGLIGLNGAAAFNCGFSYPGSGVNFGGGASGSGGGTAGPQDAGGANVGTAGTSGVGGNGSAGQYDVAGGGGGGGYFGGGGGGGAGNGSGVGGGGGGGGASYLGTLTSASTATGVRVGDGEIKFIWAGSACTASTRTSVTVTIDSAGPSIACPANITAVAGATCATTVNFNTPVGVDNCPGVTTTQIGGFPSGVSYFVGTMTNIYVTTDATGAVDSCSFTVTVTDTVAPTATCQPITLYLDATGSASVVAGDVDNGSIDNCSNITLSTDILTVDCDEMPSTDVVLTATDISGNTASCTTQILVMDTVAPTAVCQSFTLYLSQGGAGLLLPTDVGSGSSDPCGILAMSVTPSTFSLGDVGANNVVLTVTDSSANSSSCTATVTVVDSFAVGIKDPMGSGISFSASPNPTTGHVEVMIDCPVCLVGEAIELKLWNASGQLLVSKELTTHSRTMSAGFDLSSYASGNYVLSMEVDGKVLQQKVLKY